MPAPKDPEKYEEWRRKVSEARKGKSGPNKGRKFSDEHKAKLAAAKRGKPGPWLGKHRDEETKTKISENLKGKKPSPERYARQLEGIQRYTENLTPEQREKMGWNRGISWSDEVKQKIGKGNKGKLSPIKGVKFSEEIKAVRYATRRGRPSPNKGRPMPAHVKKMLASPEIRAKNGIAHSRKFAMLSPEEKAMKLMAWIEAGRKHQASSDTSIERFVAQQLDDFQIIYEQQRRIGLYFADFFIPADNLIIEVNGCYWHGCEVCGFNEEYHQNKRILDAKRLAYLESKGYTVGIVWEHDLRPYMEESEK